MEYCAIEVQEHAIRSLQSSIRKLRKALASVEQGKVSITVVAKRLKALEVGLAALSALWDDQPFPYSHEQAREAAAIIKGLFPSLQAMAEKFPAASSQATLLARRIRALELAMQALGEM